MENPSGKALLFHSEHQNEVLEGLVSTDKVEQNELGVIPPLK
jgi:hypothetical protein